MRPIVTEATDSDGATAPANVTSDDTHRQTVRTAYAAVAQASEAGEASGNGAAAVVRRTLSR